MALLLSGFSTAVIADEAARLAEIISARNDDAVPRLYQSLALLKQASDNRKSPERTIREASRIAGLTPEHEDLLRYQLLKNYSTANGFGLLEGDNIVKLQNGQPATIQVGSYKGQTALADRIIPSTQLPEIANELANMRLSSESNIAKWSRNPTFIDPELSSRLQALAPSNRPQQVREPDNRQQEFSDTVELEVELGTPLYLASLGGPDKNLVINSENSSSISFSIVDPTQMRQVIRYDAFGYAYTELVPTVTPQRISKENAISLPGTVSKLYPLYSDDILTIYFFDTLATKQNHRKIIIDYR